MMCLRCDWFVSSKIFVRSSLPYFISFWFTAGYGMRLGWRASFTNLVTMNYSWNSLWTWRWESKWLRYLFHFSVQVELRHNVVILYMLCWCILGFWYGVDNSSWHRRAYLSFWNLLWVFFKKIAWKYLCRCGCSYLSKLCESYRSGGFFIFILNI